MYFLSFWKGDSGTKGRRDKMSISNGWRLPNEPTTLALDFNLFIFFLQCVIVSLLCTWFQLIIFFFLSVQCVIVSYIERCEWDKREARQNEQPRVAETKQTKGRLINTRPYSNSETNICTHWFSVATNTCLVRWGWGWEVLKKEQGGGNGWKIIDRRICFHFSWRDNSRHRDNSLKFVVPLAIFHGKG